MLRWPQFLQQANFGQIRGAGELARSLQSWRVILKKGVFVIEVFLYTAGV